MDVLVWLLAATVIARVVVEIWPLSGIGLLVLRRFGSRRRWPWLKHLWAELKPWYLPSATLLSGISFADASPFAPAWAVYLGIDIGLFLLLRNAGDDDDRWRRRGRRLADAVRRLGARLVATPATERA